MRFPVLFLIMLLAASILLGTMAADAQQENQIRYKLKVRIYLTYFWANERADLDNDIPNGDSDVWVFSLIREEEHETQTKAIGEKEDLDQHCCDLDGNGKYSDGDKRIEVLNLYSGKVIRTDVVYEVEQCEPVRPFHIYIKSIDSDVGGSETVKYVSSVVKGISSVVKSIKPFAKLISSLASFISNKFKDHEVIGSGVKNSWLPSKAYEVKPGAKQGKRWNLGPEKIWKIGEAPPPGKTWVSEEVPVELKESGELRAIVWYRLEVYNTGIPCSCQKIKAPEKENPRALKSLELIRRSDVSEMEFHLETSDDPHSGTNISIRMNGEEVARIWGGEEILWSGNVKSLWSGNKEISGVLNLSSVKGPTKLEFVSYGPGGIVNSVAADVVVPEPDLCVVANEIDLRMSAELLSSLENKGYHYSLCRPSNLRSPVVLVLGGPESYSGVGDFVSSLLPQSKVHEVREKPTSTHVKVGERDFYISGGPDRYGTREAAESCLESLVKTLAERDLRPPQIWWPVSTEVEADRNFTIVWSEPVSSIEMKVFSKDVPISGVKVFHEGRTSRVVLPDLSPKNLTLLMKVVDLRGNSADLTLEVVRTGEPVPYLVYHPQIVDKKGLTWTLVVEIENLGDEFGTVSFVGVKGNPSFIKVSPLGSGSFVIEPGGVRGMTFTLSIGEDAKVGTYTFKLLFHESSTGVMSEVEVTVKIWKE